MVCPSTARVIRMVEPGQHDPRWWVPLVLRRLGLAWGLRQPGDMTPLSGLRRVPALPGDIRN